MAVDAWSSTVLTIIVYFAALTPFVHCLKFRRRNPRVRFAFPAISEICLDHVRFSVTLTHRL